MRRVSFYVGSVKDQAVASALLEIAAASADQNIVDMMSSYTITGSFTETRTLDVGTSTLAQTQAFLATLVNDLKRGGQHKTG